jgi:hypothetical protein
MFTGPFSAPEVVAFPALPHLHPFVILQENIHHFAVLISGHHGPIVFAFSNCTHVCSNLAFLRRYVCSDSYLDNGANGRRGFSARLVAAFFSCLLFLKLKANII